MTGPMTPRERIVITLAVCLTILVAAPMTALAATGQLVNIVDPSSSSRKARVTAVGALQVQARLGIPSGAISFQGTREGSGWIVLGSVLAPNATAMTEITAWSAGTGGVMLVQLQHSLVGNAATCATPPSSPSITRRMLVPVNTQEQLVFPSPLYLSAAPTGQKRCIFAYVSGPSGANHYVAISGYQYAP